MDYPELSEIEKAIEAEEESYIEQAGEALKKKVAENNGQFSETIPIMPNGFLDLTDETGSLRSYFAHVANAGGKEAVEGLYKLAYNVQRKNPELAFTFERDTEGRSIIYTVRENSKK